jgi:hypothetical protein
MRKSRKVLVASLYACANRFSATIGLVADF